MTLPPGLEMLAEFSNPAQPEREMETPRRRVGEHVPLWRVAVVIFVTVVVFFSLVVIVLLVFFVVFVGFFSQADVGSREVWGEVFWAYSVHI
jgi:hypothetical protein